MSEKKDYDLEPDRCPFCGSDNVDPAGWKNGEGETGPACNNCNATADSVEEWNTRPTETALRATNKQLILELHDVKMNESKLSKRIIQLQADAN